MMWLAFVMTFAVAGCLLFDPMLEAKYHMYLKVDKKTEKAKIWQDGKCKCLPIEIIWKARCRGVTRWCV